MTDIENWKEKIKKIGCSEVEIIPIHAGILIQAISISSTKINLDVLKKQILDTCIDIHKDLPQGKNAFPFKIFCYENDNDSYKVDASFKNKLNDSNDGVFTTYLTEEDALVSIREIDAEAILYEVSRPFGFKFKETNELFKFNKYRKYKSLSFSGLNFLIEDFILEKKGRFLGNNLAVKKYLLLYLIFLQKLDISLKY